MVITVQKAVDSVVGYLGCELAKIASPAKRFASMFAVGAMAANPSVFVEKAKLLGIVNEQGMVDTDLVRSGFATAFSGGNTVELLGLTFSHADGENLLKMMES